MFYNHQRDYIPGIGRYAQSDPMGGINTYSYRRLTPRQRRPWVANHPSRVVLFRRSTDPRPYTDRSHPAIWWPGETLDSGRRPPCRLHTSRPCPGDPEAKIVRGGGWSDLGAQDRSQCHAEIACHRSMCWPGRIMLDMGERTQGGRGGLHDLPEDEQAELLAVLAKLCRCKKCGSVGGTGSCAHSTYGGHSFGVPVEFIEVQK